MLQLHVPGGQGSVARFLSAEESLGAFVPLSGSICDQRQLVDPKCNESPSQLPLLAGKAQRGTLFVV
jgi:hypothetical protein